MSGGLDHRRWRADIAAYLLGALEADEIAALESHLETCDRCREELHWLQPAIDVLPESVEQLDPPPGLRTRLLAEVRGDAAGAAAHEPARAERPGLFAGLGRFFLRPAVAGTAVALIVAVAAGYAVRGGGGESQTTTIAGPVDGSVRATLERSGDSGTLMLTGLRQLPRSDVYQVWVQREGRIEPTDSLFEARHDGTASAAIPHQLAGAKAVMVTREPRGGSKQPSSSPIVNVPLPG